MLGGGLRQLLEARQLAVGLLAHVLGQRDRSQLLAQLVDLGLGRVALAQLGLDRLELLAQHVLALRVVELGLHLGLDPRPDRRHLELAREHLGEAVQPLADVELLQQRLLLLRLDPQRAGYQVRQRRRVVQVGDGHLELLGEVRDVLDDAQERLLHVAHQRGQLGALVEHVRRLDDARDEVGLTGYEAGQAHARARLDEDPQRAVGHLEHSRDRAEHAVLVDLVGPGGVDFGLAARDHRQHAVAAEHVIDELDRALLPDRQRRQRVREGDAVAQRQDGQLPGQLGRQAERDLLAAAARGGDLDHDLASVSRIGTLREPLGARIGSSTVSMPSS